MAQFPLRERPSVDPSWLPPMKQFAHFRRFLTAALLGSGLALSQAQTCWVVEGSFTSTFFDFGSLVALSGDTFVAFDGNEAGDVFVRDDGEWTLQDRLIPSTSFAFGAEALAIDGDVAVLTDGDNDDAGLDAGTAFVFRRTGTTWTQEAQVFASDAFINAEFGVSLSLDGDRFAVGSWRRTSVYVFERQGTAWVETQRIFNSSFRFGEAVALDGDTLIVGDGRDQVFVYQNAGGAWGLVDTLQPPLVPGRSGRR